MPQDREVHVCRNCRTEGVHRVVRDRVLAPVHWCLRCFHVWHSDHLSEHDGSERDRLPLTASRSPQPWNRESRLDRTVAAPDRR